MRRDGFGSAGVKGKLRASICIFLVLAELFLIIAAAILHNKYGKGLGYYTLIIIPLLSILIGMVSGLIKKYWIFAAAIFHLSVILCAYKSSNGDIVRFIPFQLTYILLSIIAGYAFQKQ